MKTLICLLTVGAALTAPAALHARIVRTVEKSFAVQPGGLFKAGTQGGDIIIKTADVSQVQVTARQTIRTNDEKEADELLAGMSFKIEQQGNEVIAEAKHDRSSGWRRWPVTVDFIVTVPRAFNVQLTTSGGDIDVDDLKGRVSARTSGGDLKFERIDGDLEGITSGGDIYLREGTASAKLHTSGGDVVVERAGGPTKVSTSGGNIRLKEVAELISATTSGGDIFANITGPIKADTLLSTSGGEVDVRVAKGVGFELDANTSSGDVDAAGLTLTIDRGGLGKTRLVGTVNGGGPRLKLRSSGGDITIRSE